MTVEIIIELGEFKPGMTMEDYVLTQVKRTTDPDRVAEEIITTGTAADGPKIVIMGDDEEPMYWLNVPQAVAFARRLIKLAAETTPQRTVRRAPDVGEHLRALDD